MAARSSEVDIPGSERTFRTARLRILVHGSDLIQGGVVDVAALR